MRRCDADEVNESYAYRIEMQAFTILSEKMAEALLATIERFLSVWWEEAGERSC